MAKRVSTVVLDDLTGAALGAEAVTIAFAFEGVGYELDLSPASADGLREALAPYVAAGRKLSRRQGAQSRPKAPAGEQSAARAWLTAQGIDVPSRGRLSAELIERYRAR